MKLQVTHQIETRLWLCCLWLCISDPIQNHALRLCLGAYRTSPYSSLSVLANEPRRKRLSMQYCLKLSFTAQNPAYSGVFAGKFKFAFDRKPNQISPLGIRVQPDLHAIGFKQKDTVQSSISATPPKMLTAHGSTCVIGQPPKSLQTVLHSILLF